MSTGGRRDGHQRGGAMLTTVLVILVVSVVAALAWWKLREPTPDERLAALQREVAPKDGVVFRTTLQGVPVAFLLLDCEVFLLDVTGRKVERTKVLKTGFYPWFKACTGQSLRVEDGHLVAVLENRAIGAGGGNTSGGTYRSLDGRNWEKWTSKGWLPVDEAQP